VRAATKPDGTGRKTFNLKTDVDLLEKMAIEIGDVRLIVVDPISAYMGGADGNGNVETREVLEPLAEMANRLRIAVVAVTHLNKGGGGGQTAMNRFTGSIAFIAAARTAYLVVADPENPDRRFLLQVKNNLAKESNGLVFRMEQRLVAEDIVSSHVIFFDEQVSMSVEQALGAYEAHGRNGSHASGKQAAVEFLAELLANGPMDVEAVECHARQAGLLDDSKRIGDRKPFRDARAALGVVNKRVGFGKGARYEVSLPADTCAPQSIMGAHS
jgi:putative DNA primase/helicase